MKLCYNCKLYKKDEEFSWKKIYKQRQSTCKGCHKEYRKIHYLNNKQKYLDKAKFWNNIYKKEARIKLLKYFQNHFCIDCGEKDPIVLEFDHVRGIKIDAISVMVGNSRPWKIILEEIQKCDVRCANCHRRKTAIQLGWDKIWK